MHGCKFMAHIHFPLPFFWLPLRTNALEPCQDEQTTASLHAKPSRGELLVYVALNAKRHNVLQKSASMFVVSTVLAKQIVQNFAVFDCSSREFVETVRNQEMQTQT